MSDYTPPTGGSLPYTCEVSPGDRIASALASLHETPLPGWLWALWVPSLEGGASNPLAGPMPADASVETVSKAPGAKWYEATPPHYGIVPREAMPTHGGKAPPEMLGQVLSHMLARGEDSPGRMCGCCVPTGIPGDLMGYLAEEAFLGDIPPAVGTVYSSLRHTVALEVASARVQRDLYIHALRSGMAPAGWCAEAENMAEVNGHYLARMSDTGLAVGVCSVLWYPEALEAGLPYLMPVEVLAGLAKGFAYPVPVPYSPEWQAQAASDEYMPGFPLCALLSHEADNMRDSLTNGVIPWEGPLGGVTR